MKKILIIYVLAIFFAGCKKDISCNSDKGTVIIFTLSDVNIAIDKDRFSLERGQSKTIEKEQGTCNIGFVDAKDFSKTSWISVNVKKCETVKVFY